LAPDGSICVRKNGRSQYKRWAKSRGHRNITGTCWLVSSQIPAWKMHVDFSHPWIVALERELIGINKNELTLDRILARNRSRVRERVFLA
jgi:hypothetical protein